MLTGQLIAWKQISVKFNFCFRIFPLQYCARFCSGLTVRTKWKGKPFIMGNCLIIDFFKNCKWSVNTRVSLMDSVHIYGFYCQTTNKQYLRKYFHLYLGWGGARVWFNRGEYRHRPLYQMITNWAVQNSSWTQIYASLGPNELKLSPWIAPQHRRYDNNNKNNQQEYSPYGIKHNC